MKPGGPRAGPHRRIRGSGSPTAPERAGSRVEVVSYRLLGRRVQRLGQPVEGRGLGTGKRLFGEGTVPSALRLTESVTHAHGTLQLTYEPAGAPAYGDAAA